MNLPIKPHVLALICSAGMLAAAGTLYIKSRPQEVSVPVPASAPTVAAAAPETPPAPEVKKDYTSAQINQWVAPIALYPDALLSQVLMASTYPASVVQAAQWSKEHPALKGDAAIQAASDLPWDASVKSLVAFPQLTALMGQDPQWVENLGNAFLAQPQDVMDAVQRLRQLAQQTGTLKSTVEQKVIVSAPPKTTAPATQTAVANRTDRPQRTIIKIEPTNPEVIYIPNYNPTVVYGTWPDAAYPPTYLAPPQGEPFVDSFVKGFGYSMGVATTYALFSSIDWDRDDHHHHDHDHDDDRHHHDEGHNGGYIHNGDNININVNNYNHITGQHLTEANRVWQHDPAYRNGIPNGHPAHPVNVSSGLSASAAPDIHRDAQRQAASKQLDRIVQQDNGRGYDARNTRRDAAPGLLQQHLASDSPVDHQERRENIQHYLHSTTPEQRQVNREKIHQQRSSATAVQRQERRDNIQQRLNTLAPAQRQQLQENVQHRRDAFHANALSGNDSRSPSWQSQRQRGGESQRLESHINSEQRSALRERIAEHRRH